MKKSLIAMAVLAGIAGTAAAQSTVTLSGSLDAGLNRAPAAAGAVTKMQGAGSSRNNLTFSGVEDLGNGNSAFFTLNHRFAIQNGTQNGANGVGANGNTQDTAQQFYRNVWVGLKNNNVGDVRLGRMLMPMQELNGGFEAFYGGDSVASVHTDGRGNVASQSGLRTNEGTYLRSASFGGLVLHGGYGRKLGGGTQTDIVAPKGFGATFAFGPATIGLATDTNGNDKSSAGLYAKYNAGFAVFYTQFERGDTVTAAPAKDKRFSISADVPVGDFTIKAGVRSMNRTDLTGSVRKVGLGAEYALSKRTKIYTAVAKASGSDAELGASAATTALAATNLKKAGFDVGIWHKF